MRTPRVKLVPPRLPASHVPRPALERLLEEAERRRLTSIVAGPGFGKSTLAASVAVERGWAWYLVDGDDASPAALVRGLSDTLHLDVSASLFMGSTTTALQQAFARALDETVQEELVLVLDDVHELGHGPESTGVLELLVRQAPPELHLVLCSREDVPFSVERLRGQGQVLDIDAPVLAFSSSETADLIDPVGADLAPRIHQLTAGWPVAVQLAAGLLQTLPADERPIAVDKLNNRRGPLFRYLAEEVVQRERPEVAGLLQTVAVFDSFSADLCKALGVGTSVETLVDLQRRGFVSTSEESGDLLSLHSLLRDFIRETRPLEPDAARSVLRTGSEWFEARGMIPEALATRRRAGEPEQVVRLLREHGQKLYHTGFSDVSIDAADAVPGALLDEEVKRWLAFAHYLRGDPHKTMSYLSELAEAEGMVGTDAAFMLANQHCLQGDLRTALELFQGAAAGHPLSLAFSSWPYRALGDLEAARDASLRALSQARQVGFVGGTDALSEAHLTLGDVFLAEGDLSGAATSYEEALGGILVTGNRLAECSARARLGGLRLAEARFDDALAKTEEALTLAERVGFAMFVAWCLALRGDIKTALGRLDEAASDYAAAKNEFDRLATRLVAWPLIGLAEVHTQRGELAQAQATAEAALALAEQSEYLSHRVASLAALARVLLSDDPSAALAAAEEAVGLGGEARVKALVARGWVRLAVGETAGAARAAAEAASDARLLADRRGLAESLELQAFCSDTPELAMLEEARAIWRELGAAVATARVELALARLSGSRLEAERARRALRRLGVGETAARAAGILMALGTERPAPLAIQTLGGFRVLREGVPLAQDAWRSKKSRDLLKILAARRGHPVVRDELIEALWPEEDPARTGNRLSVALSTLRSMLDPDRAHPTDHFVAAHDGAVQLALAHVDLDVESFLQEAHTGLRLSNAGRADDALPALEAAEAAYTGNFLEEDRYHDWAEPLRNEALAVYIEILRALGHATGAPRYFLRIIERDRYDEQAHLGLVSVLAESGAYGEARQAYRSYVGSMQEIGAEPAPFQELAPSRERMRS